jgi:septal ring-binding cell division protein DamX
MNQEFNMKKILVLSIASILSSFVLAQSAEVSTTATEEATVAVTAEESTEAQAATTEESDAAAVAAQ